MFGRDVTALMANPDQWLLRSAPAERLATLRVLVSGFVVVYLTATVGEFARLANRAPAEFEPVGVAKILSEPLPATMLWALFAVLIIAGIASLLGASWRISGPVFAIATLSWASYHSSWGQLLHFEHLFTLHLLIIALSPAADAWAVDARRGDRPRLAESVRYGWPIRLMAITTAATYVIAGIAKLRASGFTWIDGTTLRNHIAYSATRLDLLGGFEPPLASLVVGQAWTLAPMAVAALLIELVAPVALFGGRWRSIWVASVIAMHLGTAATMFIWFPYPLLGFAFLPLFRVEELGWRVEARLAAQ